MTKYEKLDYLTRWVESQGTQAGLSIVPLLRNMIEENEDIFDVEVEDTEVNGRLVVNEQIAIDEFIDAVNADPIHNVARVHIKGVVLHFVQIEYTESEVHSFVEIMGGKYTLKLSREVGQSELTYTPNA